MKTSINTYIRVDYLATSHPQTLLSQYVLCAKLSFLFINFLNKALSLFIRIDLFTSHYLDALFPKLLTRDVL